MKIAHLRCPSCSKPHIDEDAWALRPHQTHRCVDDTAGAGCQHEWEADEKCVSTWEPKALLSRATEIAANRWPGRWRVGTVDKNQIWAPHPAGIGGYAGERLVARINALGRPQDAVFIADAPQLIDALIKALSEAIPATGHLGEISQEFAAQNLQWGGPAHDDGHTSHDWIAIITSHLGKAVTYPFRLDVFRRQMVKVGGLALAGLRWADRYRASLEKKAGVAK